MQEEKKVRLLFNMSLSAMLLRARAMYANFVHDQPAFEAINPKLNAAWRDAFAAELDTIEGMVLPEFLRGDTNDATAEVENAMQEVLRQLQILFAYVRMAWPGDKSQIDAFGVPRYTKARSNQGQLLLLMRMAHAEAVAQAATLTEWGYTAANADALLAASEALETAKAAQLKMLANRPVQTAAYYRLANAIWARLQALNDARGLAFADNYARWSLYALYPKSYYTRKKHRVVVKGEKEAVVPAEGESEAVEKETKFEE